MDIDNEVFVLDSTTIFLSVKLFTWTSGKYSRGAVKIHTLLDLRGSIPSFVLITDEKYHDSNVLDVIIPFANAIYLIDKVYVDLVALYCMQRADTFFVIRAKFSLEYSVLEQNFNIDE